jgi:hypothetical protein
VTLIDQIEFTWSGVICTVIGPTSGVLTVPDWLPELRQQERPWGGTGNVQVPSFGHIYRWQGDIWVASATDYGTLRTAFLARPRTVATWSDGSRSIANVVLIQFRLLPLIATGEGYTGPVEFVATGGL